MNHVAHCFLSYPDADLLLGNFIGDFVKGRSWQNYPDGIRHGILLHRAIDVFTDAHPATHTMVGRIRPFAGRYAAPVADILYDHLLWRKWGEYVQELPFDAFATWVYDALDARQASMPAELQQRWPLMLQGNFLQGYQSRKGLEWVLTQFNRRLSGQLQVPELSSYFFIEINVFLAGFDVFFPDLVKHVADFRNGVQAKST